jgi:hypothetical protein
MAPNDPVQFDHERRIRRLEQARHDLESAASVTSRLDSSAAAEHDEFRVRMERTLAEITEKLSRLKGGCGHNCPPHKK